MLVKDTVRAGFGLALGAKVSENMGRVIPLHSPPGFPLFGLISTLPCTSQPEASFE
jgi:hypothetical protein